MSKTYIKGKDSALEDSIVSISTKLTNAGIELDYKELLNPANNIYSLLIQDKNCPLLFSNGKGASKKASLASALGEFAERLSCNYFFADYYLGKQIANAPYTNYKNEKWFNYNKDTLDIPEGILTPKLLNYYNPNQELSALELIDINSGLSSRGVCTLEFIEFSTKKSVYFPLNILNNLYVSNGMAAGNTQEEAQVQALCEIYERYAKNQIISKAITMPQIKKSEISKYVSSLNAIEDLENQGFIIDIYDASLNGIYPVVCVTLTNQEDGTILASFGSHPIFEVALERTITELMQGRDKSKLNDLQSPTFNIDIVASSQNLESHFINATGALSYDNFTKDSSYRFKEWNINSNTKEQLEYLQNIALNQGLEIYTATYNHLGVESCRIIIPTISEIYEIEDLIYNNNNEGAFFAEAILSLKYLNNKELQELLENLEELAYSDTINIANFIGIIANSNTKLQTLQLGELKALIHLALGNLNEAKEWVDWVILFSSLSNKELKIYKAIEALLSIKLEQKDIKKYRKLLENLYGKDSVELAINTINQKEKFLNLQSPTLELNGLKEHNIMLNIYKRVNKL